MWGRALCRWSEAAGPWDVHVFRVDADAFLVTERKRHPKPVLVIGHGAMKRHVRNLVNRGLRIPPDLLQRIDGSDR